jgi:hypothetical protein
VHSPAELAGRTLYFDWLEYTGGWFDGHRIRCQIISVPGQLTLAPRRRRLLESADAVVFVACGTPASGKTDMAYLRELQGILQARGGVPVGTVLQANKRDLPDAVPLPQLHALLDELGVRAAVIESVASQGVGIREAFVLAVGLALDRVRELMGSGELARLPPSVDSAADLLRELELGDAAPNVQEAPLERPAAASQTLASVALCEAVQHAQASLPSASAASQGPAVPDVQVASGLLWPPVDGRLILHEITASPPQLMPLANGGWSGLAGRWQCSTTSATGFATLEQGRSALVEWARAHSQCEEILSKDRCIALVAGSDGFRLWQIIKVQRTLREYFEAALQAPPEILAVAVLTVVRTFLRMGTALAAAPCELAPSIDTTSLTETGPRYIGRMPEPAALSAARAAPPDAAELLLAELESHRPALHERRIEVLAALAQQVRASGVLHRTEWVLLQRIMLKHDGGSIDPQRRSA